MSQQNIYAARQSEDVTGAKTLDEGDSGVVQNVTATATVTLPATVVGTTYTIRNGGDNPAGTPSGAGADGSVTVTISPNASDKIMGNGFTSADNKDMINTLGNVGDEVTLVADGSAGWLVANVVGTWTREA